MLGHTSQNPWVDVVEIHGWTSSLFVELLGLGGVNQIFNVVIGLRFGFYCLLLEGDKRGGSIKSFIRAEYL